MRRNGPKMEVTYATDGRRALEAISDAELQARVDREARARAVKHAGVVTRRQV